jgi:type I restriction enzyme S subunit
MGFERYDVGNSNPTLNRNHIHGLDILIPPLRTQKAIVEILSTYDELIENNRRRIQLLEQAARLLYKEWFVHLRFPGHEHTPIIEGVPEGWEKTCYNELFEFHGGFAFKSKTYQAEGKYGIVTIKNVHDARFVPECSSRLDSVPDKMKPHCLLSTGDILLSLTGNVGRACIAYGENFLLNQRVAKIVGKDIPRSFVYWTFSSDASQRELENLAYGVAQLNLSPVKLGEQEFLRPSSMLLEMFAEICEPVFQQICTLNLSNQQLTKARDLLLPKLMNGEVAV